MGGAMLRVLVGEDEDSVTGFSSGGLPLQAARMINKSTTNDGE